MTDPRPGDRVKIEYEAEYRNGDLVTPDGELHLIPDGAKVTVIKRKVDLVPGQVWKLKCSGSLYVVVRDARTYLRRVDSDYPYLTTDEFHPEQWTKLFDPRWGEPKEDMLYDRDGKRTHVSIYFTVPYQEDPR